MRLTSSPAGSRIDVRSVSRVGASDLGTNARRIRAYLARVMSGAQPETSSPVDGVLEPGGRDMSETDGSE